MNAQHFYVGLLQEDERPVGFCYGMDPRAMTSRNAAADDDKQVADTPLNPNALTFAEVFHSFKGVMESYRKFVPLTLQVVPLLSFAIADTSIRGFVENFGVPCKEFSNDRINMYSLPMDRFREFHQCRQEAVASLEGAEQLPMVMIIGLVSAYDSFLAKLLTVAIQTHPGLVDASDRSFTVAELRKFGTLNRVIAAQVESDVERIMRDSHQSQIDYIDNKLLKPHSLRQVLQGNKAWPTFIEIFERRNLLTHTGGIVNQKYIQNCRDNGVPLDGVSLGSTLEVDASYFTKAVSSIYEVGILVCWLVWRKLVKSERDNADKVLNELALFLITVRAYDIAERLLTEATNLLAKQGVDRTYKMMVVNHANALKLQGRKTEALQILHKID